MVSSRCRVCVPPALGSHVYVGATRAARKVLRLFPQAANSQPLPLLTLRSSRCVTRRSTSHTSQRTQPPMRVHRRYRRNTHSGPRRKTNRPGIRGQVHGSVNLDMTQHFGGRPGPYQRDQVQNSLLLIPREEPHVVSYSATYLSGQMYTTVASLSYLPDPLSGSITRLDSHTGGLWTKPFNARRATDCTPQCSPLDFALRLTIIWREPFDIG